MHRIILKSLSWATQKLDLVSYLTAENLCAPSTTPCLEARPATQYNVRKPVRTQQVDAAARVYHNYQKRGLQGARREFWGAPRLRVVKGAVEAFLSWTGLSGMIMMRELPVRV